MGAVAPMGFAHRARQALTVCRHHHQMNMIGHQAVRDFHCVLLARLRHQVQVQRVVGVLEENALAPVPTLRDVVRHLRDHDAGESGQ